MATNGSFYPGADGGTPASVITHGFNGTQQTAVNGNDSKIVRFEANIPQVVAIKYPEGKLVEGNFGEQLMYSLADGRVMYVCPVVAQQINTLEIRPNELFSILKRQAMEPGKKKASTRWIVERVRQASPPLAAVLHERPYNAAGIPSPRIKIPMDLAVVQAVRMVQKAMKETGEQWSDQSRQDLVSTILIGMQKEGWLAPEGVTPPEPPPPTPTAAPAPPVGTQASADHVAQQKIQSANPATSKPWNTFGEMKRIFAQLREQVGESEYLAEFARHGWKDVNDIKALEPAIECYHHLAFLASRDKEVM